MIIIGIVVLGYLLINYAGTDNDDNDTDMINSIQKFESKCENTRGMFAETTLDGYTICECQGGVANLDTTVFYYRDVKNTAWEGCGAEGAYCNMEDEDNTGCRPGLLCGEGNPDNRFEDTCMTLAQCIEIGNTANAVEGSTICFMGDDVFWE